jgi:hypothetical protein
VHDRQTGLNDQYADEVYATIARYFCAAYDRSVTFMRVFCRMRAGNYVLKKQPFSKKAARNERAHLLLASLLISKQEASSLKQAETSE